MRDPKPARLATPHRSVNSLLGLTSVIMSWRPSAVKKAALAPRFAVIRVRCEPTTYYHLSHCLRPLYSPCHPGPCPRCPVTVQNPCHCGKTVLTLRCSQLNGTVPGARSCGQVCNRTLACGKHQCQQNCHEGDCAPCTVLDEVTCYCGAQEKAVDCGQGVAKPCANPETGTNWQGKFQCEAICNR